MRSVPDQTMNRRLGEIETLVAQVEKLSGSAGGEQVEKMAMLVMDLHRDALKRMIRLLRQGGREGETLLAALAEDALVAAVLLLHDLHPMSMEDRVRTAVEKVRPYLQTHGGDVELLGMPEGKASLRMSGDCGGCPAMADSLRLMIEKTVLDAAPDLAGLDIQTAPADPAEA